MLNPRLIIPESFDRALTYEEQIQFLLRYCDELAAQIGTSDELEQIKRDLQALQQTVQGQDAKIDAAKSAAESAESKADAAQTEASAAKTAAEAAKIEAGAATEALAELRQTVQSLKVEVEANEKRVDSLETSWEELDADFKAVQKDATDAKSTAQTASETADAANTAAGKAQTAAEAAQSAADDAAAKAETATQDASTAKSTAQAANETAEAAKSAAETAQSTAETAQSAAETAQSTADAASTEAGAAKTAAEAADTKAEAAQTKADALETSKQDKLTFDDAPKDGSKNPVTSEGIKAYVDEHGGGSSGGSTAESVYELAGHRYIMAGGAIRRIIRPGHIVGQSPSDGLLLFVETNSGLQRVTASGITSGISPANTVAVETSTGVIMIVWSRTMYYGVIKPGAESVEFSNIDNQYYSSNVAPYIVLYEPPTFDSDKNVEVNSVIVVTNGTGNSYAYRISQPSDGAATVTQIWSSDLFGFDSGANKIATNGISFVGLTLGGGYLYYRDGDALKSVNLQSYFTSTLPTYSGYWSIPDHVFHDGRHWVFTISGHVFIVEDKITELGALLYTWDVDGSDYIYGDGWFGAKSFSTDYKILDTDALAEIDGIPGTTDYCFSTNNKTLTSATSKYLADKPATSGITTRLNILRDHI